tara:strand:+ start:7990 stop:8154 length:165 start_codon:yes stop_codon:yes gene_type:complete
MRKSEGVAYTVWLNAIKGVRVLVKNKMSLSELKELYDADTDTEDVKGRAKNEEN